MSLFDGLVYDWTFKCENPSCGQLSSKTASAADGEPAPPPCCDCGWKTRRTSFRAANYNVATTVQGEQNGRVYYETRDANGKVSRVSKTKKDWIDKGVNKSGLTKEYTEHMREQVRELGYREAKKAAFKENNPKAAVYNAQKKEYNSSK